MQRKPKLALVGRPNVGKSALFNCISKQRISIVNEEEGVTRDRIYAETDLFGRHFDLIDTGGITTGQQEDFSTEIRRQAEIAIEEADAIILVVDSTTGATALDHEVAKILHRTSKPLCVAINKVDNPERKDEIHAFYGLGIPSMIPVSAEHNWQIAELIESALDHVEIDEQTSPDPILPKIALLGRPNVGKSSLLNTLAEENRCVVSPIPGTTRDSIDVDIIHDEQSYTFIDTAGIRRKHAEHSVIDKFASMRTKRSIERCDVCLLMIDAVDNLTTQEKRIATQVEKAGKGLILLINKWDLMSETRMEHYLKRIEDSVPFLKHCPKIIISAKTKRNISQIFLSLQEVLAATKLRIPTPKLNRFIEKAMQMTPPPMIQGKRLRIYYMTQTQTEPPKFTLFINYPDLMAGFYKRYLINQFRKEFVFKGTPISFHLKGKKDPQKK